MCAKKVALPPVPYPNIPENNLGYKPIRQSSRIPKAQLNWREHFRKQDPGKFNERAKYIFCHTLSLTGRKQHSAAAAGVTAGTVNRHIETDPEFAAMVDEAMDHWRDHVHAEVIRRGMQGVEKGVWHQGTLVGRETVYSDRLLELEMKARDPAYRDKGGGEVNVNVQQHGVLVVPPAMMGQEEWEAEFGPESDAKPPIEHDGG